MRERDCVFLVADSNMKACIEGFLGRPQFHRNLGTGPFTFESRQDLIVGDGRNDPGVYIHAHELLRPYLKSHRYAVIILDCEWDGSPGSECILRDIQNRMQSNGWTEERFAIIAIDPELEAWIWQDSPHIDAALGFKGPGKLRERLLQDGTWPAGARKPPRPKEAIDAVLRSARTPRSSSLYRKITEKVSVRSCSDPSFAVLIEALRSWFPEELR